MLRLSYLLCVYCLLYLSVSRAQNIFGNGSGFLYPCHCEGDGPCDVATGRCLTGGCDTLKPPGYGWKGEGCQVGNVAYNKEAESNTIVDENNRKYNKAHLWHHHSFLLDGSLNKDIFGGSCAVFYTASKQDLAFWMVDLEETFEIINITLINTANSVDSSYLEQFDITVGNTSDRSQHERCLRHTSRIGSSATKTISCESQKVGRYLAISKYQERNRVGRLPLCEVIVLGRKWVAVDWAWCADVYPNDLWCTSCLGDTSPTCRDAPCTSNKYGFECQSTCGHCDNNVTCNARTGHCDSCDVGWKPPLCQDKCDPGTHGFHCTSECGHCNGYCNAVTGICPNGCQLWYLGNSCEDLIHVIDLTHNTQFQSLFEKRTKVILTLAVPEESMDVNHMVHVESMHEHDPTNSYTENENITLHYNNATYWLTIVVSELLPDTQHWFRVFVSRTHRGTTEAGAPTLSIKVTTRDTSAYTRSPITKLITTPQPVVKFEHLKIKSDNTKSENHHVYVSAIVVPIAVVALLAVAGVVVYIKRKNGTLTIGRYVREEGIENQGYSNDNTKIIDSMEIHVQRDDGNVYDVTSN